MLMFNKKQKALDKTWQLKGGFIPFIVCLEKNSQLNFSCLKRGLPFVMLLSIKTRVLFNNWFFLLLKAETKQVPQWQKKQKPFQPWDLSICFLTVRNCTKWETAGQETTAAYSLSSRHSPSDEEVCGQWRLSTCLRTWHSSSGHSEHTMYTQRVSHLKPHTQCTHTESVTWSLTHNVHTRSQSPQDSHTMYTHSQSITQASGNVHTQTVSHPSLTDNVHTHTVTQASQCTHTVSHPSLTDNVHTQSPKPQRQCTHTVTQASQTMYTHIQSVTQASGNVHTQTVSHPSLTDNVHTHHPSSHPSLTMYTHSQSPKPHRQCTHRVTQASQTMYTHSHPSLTDNVHTHPVSHPSLTDNVHTHTVNHLKPHRQCTHTVTQASQCTHTVSNPSLTDNVHSHPSLTDNVHSHPSLTDNVHTHPVSHPSLTDNVHTHPVSHPSLTDNVHTHTVTQASQCTHTSSQSPKPHRQCTHTYSQSPQASQTMYTHIQSVTSSLTDNVHTYSQSPKPHRQCTHTYSQSPQASQTMYTHIQSVTSSLTMYTHSHPSPNVHTSSLPPLPKPPQPLFTSKGANSYWHSPHQVLQYSGQCPYPLLAGAGPFKDQVTCPDQVFMRLVQIRCSWDLSRSGVHERKTEDRWTKAKIRVHSHKRCQLLQPMSVVHQVNPFTSPSNRPPPPPPTSMFNWQAFTPEAFSFNGMTQTALHVQ